MGSVIASYCFQLLVVVVAVVYIGIREWDGMDEYMCLFFASVERACICRVFSSVGSWIVAYVDGGPVAFLAIQVYAISSVLLPGF